MNAWNIEAQRERRQEVNQYVVDHLRPLLDDKGYSDRLVWWDQPRVAIWATNAFFSGNDEDIAFGNQILRYVRDRLGITIDACPFEAFGLAGILTHHRSKFEADTESFALDTLEKLLPFGTTADFQFHGYNDNMPVMWSWALTAGGEILNNQRFTDVAWANLCQLRDIFRRRGAVAEYGTNYSTHRITGIANIASCSASSEFRELATQLEARIWAELAGLWNRKLLQFGGAAMRGGYPFTREIYCLMRQVFGDDVLIDNFTWTDMYKTTQTTIKEMGLDPQEYIFAYAYGYSTEFANAEYHVPDQIAELFYGKEPGFSMKYTSENGYFNEGIFCNKIDKVGVGGVKSGVELTDELVVIPHFPAHAAQPHGMEIYHGDNYSVGSSLTNQFCTSHAFRALYRRNENPANIEDFGSVLVRYNINDKIPCGRHPNTYWKSPDYQEEKDNYCYLYVDQGRHHCLQKQNSVLCLQVPYAYEYWQISSMRTDLFFYNAVGKARIETISEPVESYPRDFAIDEPLFINEGLVYMVVFPLIGRHSERQCAMRLAETEQFIMLSLYNLDGDCREMSDRDMHKLGNGFVFEIRDASEYTSFDDFKNEISEYRVMDRLYGAIRSVHYATPEKRMSLEICPYTNTVREASINGLDYQIPQFEINGTVPSYVPFLDESERKGYADWDWLKIQMEREAETYNPVD